MAFSAMIGGTEPAVSDVPAWCRIIPRVAPLFVAYVATVDKGPDPYDGKYVLPVRTSPDHEEPIADRTLRVSLQPPKHIGLDWTLRMIDLRKADHKSLQYVALNPNMRMPTLNVPRRGNGASSPATRLELVFESRLMSFFDPCTS
jgi:hypothetical protein